MTDELMNQATELQQHHRDGTSQADRLLAALDPEYVAVDERSLHDLLVFAREYARELNYYDVENLDVKAMGDWSRFIDPALDLDEVVAFMEDPAGFPAEKARRYTRPHFALFLTFLRLLGHAQAQLNTLTRRHLDFYYQQVLRMTKRPGTPDRVNVLAELAPDAEQFLLPVGTLLNAGTDSLGQELRYRTERDIVVNRAQVAKLSSLYADKRVIGIREAREEHDGPKNEAFVRMLQIALGHPFPGDSLPSYPADAAVDYDYLLALQQLVDFGQSGLFMEFSDLRALMRLKQRRDQADPEWAEINGLLTIAGRQRTGNPGFVLELADPRDFEANLLAAMGDPLNFDGITEVEDIYDLYHQRIRASVQQFIREHLYFEDVNDFFRMMQLKVLIDNEWAEINRLLEKAGQEKRQQDRPYSLPPETDPTAFVANLEAAVGPLTYPGLPGGEPVETLDDYYEQILVVERYFFMAAEDFSYMMSVEEKLEATSLEWDKVYAILAGSHRDKVYRDRRRYLRKIRETEGFEAMLDSAVGDDPTQSGLTSLQRLQEYISRKEDADLLEDIDRRVEQAEAITPAEWNRVYRLIERAQRVILAEPVAHKEEWLNLYPVEDATTASVDLDIETEVDSPRWNTFGQAQASVPVGSPPPPSFGWAISSPLLALSQGRRTVTLTLGFGREEFRANLIRGLFPALSGPAARENGPFRLEISTEKGWIQADTVTVRIGDYDRLSGVSGDEEQSLRALQFELTFAENVDPIAPPPADDSLNLGSPWPVLRLMLRQIWQPDNTGVAGRFVTQYQPFKDLVLHKTHVQVGVVGLLPAQIQNDSTALAVNKPFEPFDTSAVAGARFYLSHPELIYKKLDSLQFHLEWMGVPENLRSHYANYAGAGQAAIENFTARISLIDQRLELPLAANAPLFDSPTAASAPHTIALSDIPAAIETGRPGYLYERMTELVTAADLQGWSRYVQWELNEPDFQHEAYPAVAARKSVALAAAVANNESVDAAEYQVNPPYTPKVKTLSLDYAASVEIVAERYEPGHQIDRLFHMQPFGHYEVQPDAQTGQYSFLPQFDFEGELYIGIRDAQPPQNISFLFQMAEGSANPDLEPVPIQWSYLDGNRWLSLDDGNVLLDSTRGLINSGIVAIALEPVRPSTLLAPEFYWVRAAIPRHSNSVCDTVAIHTQAVSAIFVDQENAPDHLSRPLPAGSITELAEALPEISAIHQPYTSYGGKMAEQDRTFYTRISERLRHKQRALAVWDYEHMILERFPEIYKAKCLPARPENPGLVQIVVIPDIRDKLPFNPFEPKAPADLIADIESYLADNVPAFALVSVTNAHYVPVKVRFGVRFRPGYNEGFYKQRLNEELNRFLSPWAYEEGADIVIGGRIYANVLVNFIEERPYVDYVAEIKLFSSEDGRTFKLTLPSPEGDGYWVETGRPDGVLVAARQHEIDIIPEAGYEEEAFTGINYMKIELDFLVAEG